MSYESVNNNPAVLFIVPNRFKTQGMCIKALEVDQWSMYNIPDNLKTQEICDKAIKDDCSFILKYIQNP